MKSNCNFSTSVMAQIHFLLDNLYLFVHCEDASLRLLLPFLLQMSIICWKF